MIIIVALICFGLDLLVRLLAMESCDQHPQCPFGFAAKRLMSHGRLPRLLNNHDILKSFPPGGGERKGGGAGDLGCEDVISVS